MDLNSYTCTARLVRDPELRYTQAGTMVCSMRLAIGGRKGSPERPDSTLFLSASAWGKLAELCHTHLQKGHRVGFTGRLRLNQWQSPEGENRERVEFVADEMVFLQPRAGGTGAPDGADDDPTGRLEDEADLPF